MVKFLQFNKGDSVKKKLQVFVSSTFTDLKEERQAAVSAILKAGHIPAGMELFTAGDQSQMDTIKRWIDESDVYMLILGGRYGSVEPSTGLSYTELEYDYAVSQSKPFFAVVIADNALEKRVREVGRSVLELQHPDALNRFRIKALSSMSSFYEDNKDIKLCVHETLADFALNRALKGWVSADEVPDTKPLIDEIAKLSEEKEKLKSELEATKALLLKPGRPLTTSKSYEALMPILKAKQIKVPAEAAGGKEFESSLFSVLYSTRTALVSGITNRYGISEAEKFCFYTLCPALLVHGLVKEDKVTGGKYRRYVMTQTGLDFLAECERRTLLADSKKTTEVATAEEKPQEKLPAAATPKRPRVSKKATKAATAD